MKIKPISFIIAFSLCCCLTFGQDYAFKVLVNKGRNEVKSGPRWEAVKVGASLQSPDEIKVAENAYIGLIHASGKPLELKHSGIYKITDLSAKIGTTQSVLNKYTDFILSSKTEKRNHMAATGAVHRGPSSIKMFLPPSELSYVFKDTIILHWQDKSPGPYELLFTNFFEEEISRMEAETNRVNINLAAPEFLKENDIQVQVISKKDQKVSETYIIRKLSETNKERIKSLYDEVADEVSDKSALNQLMLAGFFEQNRLLIDAATAYQKAIALEPSVQAYQDAYDDFLLRNALKDSEK